MPEPATPSRSLRRNFSWSLAGQLVYAASQWGLLVALAKFGDPELAEVRLGHFALALAISSPAVMLGNLQLRQLLATDANSRHPFRDYLRVRLILMAGVLVLCVGLGLLQRPEVRATVLIMAVAKTIEAVGDIIHGLFQREEQMNWIATSQSIRGVLSLGLFSAALAWTGRVDLATAGLLIAWVVVLLVHDVPRARGIARGPESSPGSALGPLIRRALPLGIVAGLVSLHTNLPRYQMERVGAEAALGAFASLSYFVIVLNLIARALIQVITPRLGRLWSRGDRPGLRRLLLRSLGMIATLGAVAWFVTWLFGRPLLTLLYTAEIARHAPILGWVVVLATVSAMNGVLRAYLTAADALSIQVPMIVVGLAITGAVGGWLIPTDPLAGAVAALIAGRSVQALMSGAWVLRLFTYPPAGSADT